MSFAWPSFCSTQLTISQQSFAPGVSHIFGALSVLKIRHALIVLPSKSDFHGPAFGAAGCNRRAEIRKAIVRVMPEGISRPVEAERSLKVQCELQDERGESPLV